MMHVEVSHLSCSGLNEAKLGNRARPDSTTTRSINVLLFHAEVHLDEEAPRTQACLIIHTHKNLPMTLTLV